MDIKVYNYKQECDIVEIPDNWEAIQVTVLSGDELISVDGHMVADGGKGRRVIDFYDTCYVITRDEFQRWNDRKSSYDWLFDWGDWKAE